jgi:hypothetical protein
MFDPIRSIRSEDGRRSNCSAPLIVNWVALARSTFVLPPSPSASHPIRDPPASRLRRHPITWLAGQPIIRPSVVAAPVCLRCPASPRSPRRAPVGHRPPTQDAPRPHSARWHAWPPNTYPRPITPSAFPSPGGPNTTAAAAEERDTDDPRARRAVLAGARLLPARSRLLPVVAGA